VIWEYGAQLSLECCLQLTSKFKEGGLPFPFVTYAGQTLIVQFVAAVQRELQILIEEYLIRAYCWHTQSVRLKAKGGDHVFAHWSSGVRKHT
jgi:hypothetical protein